MFDWHIIVYLYVIIIIIIIIVMINSEPFSKLSLLRLSL